MSDTTRPRVAVTMGDPAGIGPEIVLKALAAGDLQGVAIPVVYGSARLLEANRAVAGCDLGIRSVEAPADAQGAPGTVEVVECSPLAPGDFTVGAGDAKTGAFSAGCLERAIGDGVAGAVDAVIMGPSSKQAQNAAGYKFAGFQESVNHMAGCDDTIQITLGKTYNLARVTSHVPLSAVPGLCTREAVLKVIRKVDWGLKSIGYDRPRIGVSGLNPHCGEGGLMGREEIEHIGPAIADARADGIAALGPYPGDSIFLNMKAGEFDIIVTMYHDHGNACLKLAEFGSLCNLLAGGPMPVLTVFHGTAFDIAGRGLADPSSLRQALFAAAGRKAPD